MCICVTSRDGPPFQDTLPHGFMFFMPHCIIPTYAPSPGECHTMAVAQGPLMSAHVLSLPAVMTIFTKFHLWLLSSHGVNAGQPNEEILCLELHSPALV